MLSPDGEPLSRKYYSEKTERDLDADQMSKRRLNFGERRGDDERQLTVARALSEKPVGVAIAEVVRSEPVRQLRRRQADVLRQGQARQSDGVVVERRGSKLGDDRIAVRAAQLGHGAGRYERYV